MPPVPSEIISLLLMALLWWLFFWPYQAYKVDRTRCELFLIRNRLFDAAAEGNAIEFNNPAYTMTRTTINGMLRSIENYGLLRIGILIWRSSRNKPWRRACARHAIEFKRARRQLSPSGRKLVEEAMDEATKIFLGYVVRTSPIGLCILGLFWMSKAIRGIWNWGGRARRFLNHLKVIVDYESNVAGHENSSEFLKARALA